MSKSSIKLILNLKDVFLHDKGKMEGGGRERERFLQYILINCQYNSMKQRYTNTQFLPEISSNSI